ncbi:RHS repeat-associated core domain-containing protein [Pinirhizobacter soli]|uniref:RHS repeat-associated core domain-containing protein n=1 Tax=Pinirhizobacter soli TaxID=2786953 RepID=UPI00202AAFA8|nr:RHS repeat-associated core domain-containing protein [Pinirhizobacter soli]
MLLALLGNAWAAEKVTYYYTNEQGTPLATTDENGVVLTRVDYRAYGAQALGTSEQGPGYTGHVNDVDSKFVYMQQRYYDPEVGRFLSRDPAGYTAGDKFALNPYVYALNNPVNNTDPDGRQALMGMPVQHDLPEEDSKELAKTVVPGLGCALDGCGAGGWAVEAAGVMPVGKIAKLGKAAAKVVEVIEDAAKINARPTRVRTSTVKNAWESAKEGSKSGTKACPTCGKDVKVAPKEGKRDWDVDHDPKWKDRDPKPTRQEVLDDYNSDTRLRCVSCNRSDN